MTVRRKRGEMPPNYQTVRLTAGHHTGPDNGACVMELASMLAGEPFSDRPRSVSRTLAATLRGYNDGLDDVRRQALKHYAAAAIGTACGRDAERRRRRLLRAWTGELRGTGGVMAALGRRLAAIDPAQVASNVALRVRRDEDAELHQRMLDLFDALIAVATNAPAGTPARQWLVPATADEPETPYSAPAA